MMPSGVLLLKHTLPVAYFLCPYLFQRLFYNDHLLLAATFPSDCYDVFPFYRQRRISTTFQSIESQTRQIVVLSSLRKGFISIRYCHQMYFLPHLDYSFHTILFYQSQDQYQVTIKQSSDPFSKFRQQIASLDWLCEVKHKQCLEIHKNEFYFEL